MPVDLHKIAKELHKSSQAYNNSLEGGGNSDSKILAKTFEELSKDGLSQTDRDTIEKFDEILKGSDIVISPEGDRATIAQSDGKTFTVQSKGNSR